MNYPVWQLQWAGGGLIIAVVAVIHLYIAQFAVGGGLFLVLTEKLAIRLGSRVLENYLYRHVRFFLLLTMVAGAVTGVGIWFVISVLAPGATSILIHNFVFVWAAEWVCFLVEIAAIFVYYYRFRQMAPATHIKVGWIYFIAAWLSLFLVNAIVAFMLTPGKWLANGNFWAGFFNPSMAASTVFRTALSISLAGIYGLLTAVFEKDPANRQVLVRYTATWLLVPVAVLAAASFWYLASLPENRGRLLLDRWPEVLSAGRWFVWCGTAVTLAGLFLLARLPGKIQKAAVLVVLATGLVWTGAFEWMREAARRPYLISDLMYSNGLTGPQVELANAEGFASSARWMRNAPDSDSEIETGRQMFNLQCSSCHSIGGPLNDIRTRTAKFTLFGMQAHLRGQGRVNLYMPPVAGTAAEHRALARYIVEVLNGNKSAGMGNATRPPTEPAPRPAAFDPRKASHILLVWRNSAACGGLYDPRLKSLQPKPTVLHAQLIKRGHTPEIVTENVVLTCELTGHKSIALKMDAEQMTFVTDPLTLVPYATDKQLKSPLTATVVALDATSGQKIATTRLALDSPGSMGCKLCHGRSSATDGIAGADLAAGNDIVKVHDRMNHTSLAKQAAAGNSINCSDCHGKQVLGISAAIHGLHASYLSGLGTAACNSCHLGHPQAVPPATAGIHSALGMDCTSCHGSLKEHALGLLGQEKASGKRGTSRLAHMLEAISSSQIAPRKAWSQMPDCLQCHHDFQEPETDTYPLTGWSEGFGGRSDDAGIMCAACHNAAHELFPTVNPGFSLVALEHQATPYPLGSNKNCAVCHTEAMEEEIHHPNMLTMFRNLVQPNPTSREMMP